jgi:hypothetical protein
MTAPTWTVNTDTWSLARMREAAAYRAENPGVTAEEKATDAYLDAYLTACEAAAAEVGTVTERPVADDVQTTLRRGDAVASGAPTGSSRNAPSDAQLRFIASLSRDLGYDLQTPRDKAHASLIINGAKKALEELRKAGKAPAGRPARQATEGQQSYLTDLLLNRTHEHPADLDVTALTFDAASALITELRDAPRAKVAAHGIREGHYAYSTDGGQTADHYRVTRNGGIRVWSAGGEHPYRGKLNAGLEWIKENQRDAAALFGRLIGTCGRCGRVLSDDDSRARGLGPVCASKGW